MAIVLKVEDVSKKFIISHRPRQGNNMLRDAMAERLGDLGRRLRHPLRASAGEPMSGLSTSEEFWALRDINFTIEQGEVVGIIGGNGAGKSTLLKILSRVTEPTTGYVGLKGRVNSLLEVGTGFHAELTGRENIFLNGSILGLSRDAIRRKFDQIVAFAGVEKFLDTPMKRYSSGMEVRLAFAIAAHLEPEVLIIDEVLAVGDSEFQKKCLAKMREFASQGDRTILFVSHTLATIQSFCSRCLLLSGGRIVGEGPPELVIKEYLGHLEESGGGAERSFPTTASAHLRQLRLLNTEGSTAAIVVQGEDLDLEIVLDHLALAVDPRLEISVETADGLRIFAIVADLTEACALAAGDRPVQVVARIPRIPLLPGEYWINLQFERRPRETPQPLDRALKFSVVSLGGPAAANNLGRGAGIIAVQSAWSRPQLVDLNSARPPAGRP